ncbi:phosphatase 2C-like domain-containing protein [Armillaria nabsnona]|nr:phosphatase 2C-like domain-containing protein [Armillaria nabsnona]
MSTYYKFARTLRHSRRLILASGAVYAALNVRLVNDLTGFSQQYSESSLRPVPGIARFDYHVVARDELGSNHIQSISTGLPDRFWSFFALYDSYNGVDTSAYLAGNFLNAIIGGLADLFSRAKETKFSGLSDRSEVGPDPAPDEIDEEIKETFNRLDDDIVNFSAMLASNNRSSSRHLPHILDAAYSGSSATLAFYDTETRALRVAMTGNSRAILGRRGRAGESYRLEVLSADQDATNAEELARVKREHPGEEVIKDDTLFGMAPFRLFGVGPYKWAKAVRERLSWSDVKEKKTYNDVKTPPYFIAEPVITTTLVQPGDFLVIASPGLWKSLSNKEVIKEVGSALQSKKKKPSERAVVSETEEPQGSALLVYDQIVFSVWRHFEDQNLASRLVDKAFGGENEAGSVSSRSSAIDDNISESLSIGVVVFE